MQYKHNSTGLNSTALKALNRGLVLKLLLTEGKSSRIELSKATGLTKMTLSNIIGEFMEQGYVGEAALSAISTSAYSGNAGRSPVSIDILPTAPKLSGVYIARDSITAVQCDLKLNIINRVSLPLISENSASLKKKLFSVMDRVITAEVLGIGVSAIGQLDADGGVIIRPTDFFGIANFKATEILTARYGLPVFMNNDMKCAALCERLFGSGRGFDDFLYVGISNGVGCGIISDGKLYKQTGGELGHVSIDSSGIPCNCGNRGCLEKYISVPVITESLRSASGKALSFSEFCALDSVETRKVFEYLTEKLAFVLIGQVNMLCPTAVIIGHEGAWLPKRYLKLLEDEINLKKLSKLQDRVSVLSAGYGEAAPLLGSACCVLDRVFKGELLINYN